MIPDRPNHRTPQRFPCRLATRFFIAIFLTSFIASVSTATSVSSAQEPQESVFDSQGFEGFTVGQPPTQWQPFPSHSRPNVTIVSPGFNDSQKCLRGVRSSSGGLTSLARSFREPQPRVLIEFSFAFSKTKGRTLNIWSHDPGGKDATQLNLCVQGGALMQFDGRTMTWEEITREILPSENAGQPVWHRLRALVDSQSGGIDYWVCQAGKEFPKTPITRHVYRTKLPIAAIAMVSGKRVAPGGWYLIDDLRVTGGRLPAPGKVAPLPEEVTLWTGPAIPGDVNKIPFVNGVEHRTLHRAREDGYKFLHGAAIVQFKNTFYANWANSPTHENGPHETLRGRRSTDNGKTWSDVETIGAGFTGNERHSHGILFSHQGELWTICARWGAVGSGSRFRGLKGEAFVLNEEKGKWESRGIVMRNCWPYDQPVKMKNGNYITGGQDKDGLPVVAISRGDDLTHWDSVLIPFDPQLKPSFAETSVWGAKDRLVAVIRGGLNVAWVATSDDFGRTWSKALPSNMPMPRAKPYLGTLSTGQRYMLSNLGNRDTLVVSVSKPGGKTLEQMWRIRHGKSIPPRFPGRAKFKQWSYPYGFEHKGKLYVVYSVGKEDCGLSVVPIRSLKISAEPTVKARSPKVFWQAHRGGGKKEAPDNTLAAFRYTWNLGGIPEADIHTTRDGHLICIHDRTLARTTNAPNKIRKIPIHQLDLQEIQKWDAGIKWGEPFRGEKVPLLGEVFSEMKEKADRWIYLDIKNVDLETLSKLIDQFRVESQILVASPRQSDCIRLKKIAQGIRTLCWIGGNPGEIKKKFAALAASGFEGVDQVQLHLHAKRNSDPLTYQLDAEYLIQALRETQSRQVDLELFPFEFNHPSLHRLLNLGVRWFATDEPSRFKKAVSTWPVQPAE